MSSEATVAGQADEAPRLRMQGISKQFGGVQALQNVHFEAKAGEVHAVCGENGAGKSTLMKILAGSITDYEGTIELQGRPIRFGGPRDAEQHGIRIIHQELNLVSDLSVAANLFLGREKRNRLRLLDERAMEAEAARIFERLGAAIDPRARLGDLRIGDQQMVEIARALLFAADVLIMDEPTSALSDHEVSRLFRVIGDLRASGTTVIYISHKMNEVFTLADRVTVLRDGHFVQSSALAETRPEQVIRWMVGREIASLKLDTADHAGEPLLEVSDLSLARPAGSIGRPALVDISFTLRRGEVLGVAGLLGAGRTELLEALFGASGTAPTGTIRLEERDGAVSASVAGDRRGGSACDRGSQEPGFVRPDERAREYHDRSSASPGASGRGGSQGRAQGRAACDRPASREGRRRRGACDQPFGGQSAEVHSGAMAAVSASGAVTGRADARDRRGGEGRDLHVDPRAGAS